MAKILYLLLSFYGLYDVYGYPLNHDFDGYNGFQRIRATRNLKNNNEIRQIREDMKMVFPSKEWYRRKTSVKRQIPAQQQPFNSNNNAFGSYNNGFGDNYLNGYTSALVVPLGNMNPYMAMYGQQPYIPSYPLVESVRRNFIPYMDNIYKIPSKESKRINYTATSKDSAISNSSSRTGISDIYGGLLSDPGNPVEILDNMKTASIAFNQDGSTDLKEVIRAGEAKSTSEVKKDVIKKQKVNETVAIKRTAKNKAAFEKNIVDYFVNFVCGKNC